MFFVCVCFSVIKCLFDNNTDRQRICDCVSREWYKIVLVLRGTKLFLVYFIAFWGELKPQAHKMQNHSKNNHVCILLIFIGNDYGCLEAVLCVNIRTK